MYESPIKIIQSQLEMKLEDDILKAVQSRYIDVDKEELIKALVYDRNQYNKGYVDAKMECDEKLDRIVEQLEEEIEYCEKQVDKISATSFSIVNGLKRNIYIEKISAYRDAIEIVKEGGKK